MTKVNFLKDIECFPAGPRSAACHNSSIDYLNHFIIVLSFHGILH